jgi:hypothetical protein
LDQRVGAESRCREKVQRERERERERERAPIDRSTHERAFIINQAAVHGAQVDMETPYEGADELAPMPDIILLYSLPE